MYPTERRAAPAADVILDIIAGIDHLEVLRKRQREAKTVIHKYKTQRIDCGVMLCSQEGIDAPKRWGELVLMDSTHKTQKWKWRLFTLTVRDQYGSYLPAAQHPSSPPPPPPPLPTCCCSGVNPSV